MTGDKVRRGRSNRDFQAGRLEGGLEQLKRAAAAFYSKEHCYLDGPDCIKCAGDHEVNTPGQCVSPDDLTEASSLLNTAHKQGRAEAFKEVLLRGLVAAYELVGEKEREQ